MKQNNLTLSIPWRMLCLLLFFVMCLANRAHAQSIAYVTWDSQVGCIEYDNQGNPEDPKRFILTENIQDAPCIRVCENSIITYTVWGNTVNNVSWTATGGGVNNVYGTANSNAEIQWGSAGSGTIGMTITYNDNTVQNVSLCVEKILSPLAKFDLYGISKEPVFCLDTDIYFQNLSSANGGSDLFAYSWDFGDGTYSNAFEPVHSYSQPGSYDVELTVTNLCNCKSTFKMTIKIEPKPLVTINCPSTVCEYEKATYTSSDNCGGEWEIIGGTITANNGTSIDVVWDNVGPDGFGSISYLSKCLCPFWTTIRVPVVKKKGDIVGPNVICLGDQGIFSLPQWPTTDFTWTLTQTTPSATHLIFTDQRNEVVVDALAPGTYMLSCNYFNTLLGCKGEAHFKFSVQQGAEIAGDEEICSGTYHTYTNSENAYVTWTLTNSNTIVTMQSGTDFTYNFPDAGIYTLTLANGSTSCEGESFGINVYETPQPPTGPINGSKYICPGNPYEYSIANTDPNAVYEWTVTGGTIEGSNLGDAIAVVFNPSGPYAVSVVKKSSTFPGCTSAPLVLNVLPVQPNATISNNEGLTTFCPSSEATFTASFTNLVPDYVEWSFIGNFGSVIQGGNTNTVTVNFNEVQPGGSTSGILRLLIKVCGVNYTFDKNIDLYQLPSVDLSFPNTAVCYGSDILAHVNISPSVLSGTLTFDYGNGTIPYTTTGINPTGDYYIPNQYTNNSGSNFSYTVNVKLNSPNGCSYLPQDSATILVYPRTTINISPGYNYIVCSQTYTGDITLYSNAVTGLSVTATYQWTKNGVNIPGVVAQQPSYTIPTGSPAGIYRVVVTDSNNCVTTSAPITVTNNCIPVDTCTLPANANINLQASWTSCNTIDATLSYNGTATVSWANGPLETLISGNNSGAQYYTDVPGVHLIIATITFQTPNGPCTTTRQVEVNTNYKPNFNYSIACNGSGTGYNVTLFENSTVFGVDPVNNPVTYTFSGATIPTQSGQTATATNLAPGTYTFNLQITSPFGPPCSITKTVVLEPLPTASFAPLNGMYCAENPIALTITNYNPNNTYEWFFNGTSIIASGVTTYVNINAPGIYTVTLVESSPFSCTTQNTSLAFEIVKPNYASAFLSTLNTPACEGDNPGPSITFNYSGGIPPTSFDWMMGDQVISSGASNVFYPSSTGTYWVTAYDGYGCKYVGSLNTSVIIRPRPYVSVSGTAVICNGEESTVHGMAPSNDMEYRWLINSSPASGVYGSWATTTPLDIPVDTNNPGVYTFTLEVRPVSNPGCGNSASFTLTVNPPVIQPSLTYNVLSCEPYYVQVDASGPSGTYNWTNGTSGTTTYTSTGGAIAVTYTDANGCQAQATITVPRPLESLTWIVPTGCYDVCLTANPAAYVLGPSAMAIVDYYEWTINNQTYTYGSNSFVNSIAVTQAGTYQLLLEKDGCTFESPEFSVSPSFEDCKYKDCKLKVVIKDIVHRRDNVYFVYGYIDNPYNFSITVSLSSFNSYGTYVPGTITIPANTTYNFAPIQFIANPGYYGGPDVLVVQSAQLECIQLVEVKFPEIKTGRMANPDRHTAAYGPEMTIAPNPAESFTSVSYNLGDVYTTANKLIVYSVLGIPVKEVKLDKLSGQIELQTSNLASGSYIISIEADGQRALQKVLIVK